MDSSAPALVDRARKIMLQPKSEWAVIDTETTGIGDIFRSYVLVLAAIPALANLIGSIAFGYSFLGVTYRPSLMSAISTAIVSYVMALVSVFVLALIIDGLAPTFGGTRNRTQAVKVAAYSGTAAWLAGIFAIIPGLGLLGLLGLYSLYLLYLGLPLLMRAPADKALGYTAVTLIAALVLFLLLGALSASVGRMFGGHMPMMDGGTMSGAVNVPGGGSVDLGQLGAAAKQAETAAGQLAGAAGDGAPVTPVAPAALQGLLPASLGAYKRIEVSSSGANAGGLGGATAEARYENGDNSIRLTVTDIAAAGALAALGSAMNVQSNRETATGYEKTQTVNGRMVTEKWDRESRDGSYSELTANRFMIAAEGTVDDIAELRRAVATIPADRLAALAH